MSSVTPRRKKGSIATLIASFALAFCLSLLGGVATGCAQNQDKPGSTQEKTWSEEDGTVLVLKEDRDTGAVVDGDTVRLNGLDKSVRILGIDTEETYRSKKDKAAAEKDFAKYCKDKRKSEPLPVKYGTPAGQAAKVFAQKFFEGVKGVLFVVDDDKRKRGYYNRYLGHLLVDRDGDKKYEKNFAVEIVRQGHSPYYVKYGYCKKFHKEFIEAEKEARANKRGIWCASGSGPDHYPDYAERLAWWKKRAESIKRYENVDSKKPFNFQLGTSEELARLKKAAETDPKQKVKLFGTIRSRARRSPATTLAYLAHQNRKDVPVVWSDGKSFKERPLDLTPYEGRYVHVTGSVRPANSRVGFEFVLSSVQDLRME